MLTTDSILSGVLSRIRDNSTQMRTKLMGWMNELLQTLALNLDWKFLESTATLTVSENKVALPDTYGRFRFVSGENFFLAPGHRLPEERAYYTHRRGDYTLSGTATVGFTDDATHLYFHPQASGVVTLGFYRTIPEYEDGDTTILPDKFKPLIVRSLLSAYYEYDVDERALPSLALDKEALAALTKDEYRQRAIPQVSSAGFISFGNHGGYFR